MNRQTEKKNKKQNGQSRGSMIFYLGSGVLVGMVLGLLMVLIIPQDATQAEELLHFGCLLLGIYGGVLLQTVVHEAGHLVMGLISGYRFVSFRIGSLMLCRIDGRLRFKRFSIAGTGGQCLLAPPPMQDGLIPVTLYNLGGVIMNLAVSLPLGVLAIALIGQASALSILLISVALVGVFLALANGIPLKTGMVNNDGRNALHLRGDRRACEAFWIQLAVNAEQTEGKRLREMPEEWFARPDAAELQNSMVATQYVLHCNRLMDEGRLEEADAAMKALLETENATLGLHRSLLLLDRCYCALVRGSDPDGVLERWNLCELKNIRKAMKHYPAVLRTQFAYALLREQDFPASARILRQLDKVSRGYPFAGELAGERELMTLAAQIATKPAKKD